MIYAEKDEFRVANLIGAIFILLFLGSTLACASAPVRPSYSCSDVKAPLARLICSDHDLADADVRFSQAYYALLGQVDDDGRRAARRSNFQWHQDVLKQCGLPEAGEAPITAYAHAKPCLLRSYESRTMQIHGQLQELARVEAQQPRSMLEDVQRALISNGVLSGEADGIFGQATRAAIRKYHELNGTPVSSFLSLAEMQKMLGSGINRPPSGSALPSQALVSGPPPQRAWSESTVAGQLLLRRPAPQLDAELALILRLGTRTVPCGMETISTEVGLNAYVAVDQDRLLKAQGWADYRPYFDAAIEFAREVCPQVRVCTTTVSLRPLDPSGGTRSTRCEDKSHVPIKISIAPAPVLKFNYSWGANSAFEPEIIYVRGYAEPTDNRFQVKVDDANLKQARFQAERLKKEEVVAKQLDFELNAVRDNTKKLFSNRERIQNLADFIEYDQPQALAQLAMGRLFILTIESPTFSDGRFVIHNRHMSSAAKLRDEARASLGFSWPSWIQAALNSAGPLDLRVTCLVDPQDSAALRANTRIEVTGVLQAFEHGQAVFRCKPS